MAVRAVHALGVVDAPRHGPQDSRDLFAPPSKHARRAPRFVRPAGQMCSSDEGSLLEWQLDALQSLVVTSSVLSLVGSTFIMTTFHLLGRARRTPTMSLIYGLSVCDVVLSIVYVVDAATRTAATEGCGASSACKLLGALQQLFGLGAILWTICIAIALHLSVLNGSPLDAAPGMLLRMHACVWLPSIGSVVLLLATDSLGVAGQWCWVQRSAGWARVSLFYVPLVGATVYTLVVYWRVRRRLLSLQATTRRRSDDAAAPVPDASAAAEVAARGRNYLLVFGFLNAFRIANRLQNLVS